MRTRIGRLWRLARGVGRGRRGAGAAGASWNATAGSSASTDGSTSTGNHLALPGPDESVAPPPEQPVLLTASGEALPVRVGELLPARRGPWPLSVVRLPVVPKRAILAAGVCAGLAAPGLARHLAMRLLLGPPAAAAAGSVLEITRITYNGPLTPRAAAAIGKALIDARR